MIFVAVKLHDHRHQSASSRPRGQISNLCPDCPTALFEVSCLPTLVRKLKSAIHVCCAACIRRMLRNVGVRTGTSSNAGGSHGQRQRSGRAPQMCPCDRQITSSHKLTLPAAARGQSAIRLSFAARSSRILGISPLTSSHAFLCQQTKKSLQLLLINRSAL